MRRKLLDMNVNMSEFDRPHGTRHANTCCHYNQNVHPCLTRRVRAKGHRDVMFSSKLYCHDRLKHHLMKMKKEEKCISYVWRFHSKATPVQ